MKDLLPCPFCGGEARLVTGTRRDGEYVENCAFVRCERCGAKTYEFHECMTAEEVQGYATDVWNGRAERTCRRVEYRPTKNLICSECGYGIPRALDRYAFVNYCPHCGARLVTDDDA